MKGYRLFLALLAIIIVACLSEVQGQYQEQYVTPTAGYSALAPNTAQNPQQYSQFYAMTNGPAPINPIGAPQQFNVAGYLPSTLYFGEQMQPMSYSQYQSNPAYTAARSLWIKGTTAWTQYAVVPLGSTISLLAISPTGGNGFLTLVDADGQTNNNNYVFYPNSLLTFYAETAGRHTLSFSVNGQSSNQVVIEVTTGSYTQPNPNIYPGYYYPGYNYPECYYPNGGYYQGCYYPAGYYPCGCLTSTPSTPAPSGGKNNCNDSGKENRDWNISMHKKGWNSSIHNNDWNISMHNNDWNISMHKQSESSGVHANDWNSSMHKNDWSTIRDNIIQNTINDNISGNTITNNIDGNIVNGNLGNKNAVNDNTGQSTVNDNLSGRSNRGANGQNVAKNGIGQNTAMDALGRKIARDNLGQNKVRDNIGQNTGRDNLGHNKARDNNDRHSADDNSSIKDDYNNSI